MNELNPETESVELPEEESGGDAAPKTAKSLNPALFIVLVLLLVGFQTTSSWLIMGKLLEIYPYFPGSPPDPEAGLYGMLYTVEGIIVNPTDSKGTKVLLVDVGFETGSQKVIDELTALEPMLRDNINTFLSAQRLPVLTDISMRERIRDRIMDIVNYHLASGQIGRVFFIRYVLQ